MSDLEHLTQRFQRFAEVECGSSPLYHRLAMGVAGDQRLLALAEQAASTPKPNLLLAAVHYLLLRGANHPLGRHYPSVAGSATASGDPFPAFRSFCLEYEGDLLPLLMSRRVQTNEVARSAVLLPGFAHLGRTVPAPLALIEVGTSAGLLLAWDRYALDYGPAGLSGEPRSPVRISCEVRGERLPPVAAPLPSIGRRVGLDLNPIDVRDPDQALWLRALVWPDQPERYERLSQAIDLVAADPPVLVAGDALEAVPALVGESFDLNLVSVLFHCHTLNQFPSEARQRFEEMLRTLSERGDLFQLALEAVAGRPDPEMRLTRFHKGEHVRTETLARYQAHGSWIEWIA